MNRKKTLVISLVILAAAAGATVIIFLTEPTASPGGATRETAMLVNVTEARKGTFQPEIVATGTVEPAQDIILSPRVSGEVVRLSPSFTPGGYVSAGKMLLQIDPADYENRVQLRRTEVRQAEADLAIELGRQTVARKDYQLVDRELSEESRALVLREPQLKAAESRIEAAEAALRQAELDLQRTTVRAPFDAHILSRDANVGSQVQPGEALGRLVGMDTYWVSATIPLSSLRWLEFPSGETEKGTEVRVRNRTAWPEEEYRTGNLFRLVGVLENQTRMARVLVAVPDPLATEEGNRDLPRLMIGSFVEVRMRARAIPEVIRLNRDYLRKDNTVWVMEDSVLRIRDVRVLFRDPAYAYIDRGLEENEKIVTTNLSTVVDGVKLRVDESSGAASPTAMPNKMQ